ncbi:Sugar transporter ERD6-like 5 [Linum perenne]
MEEEEAQISTSLIQSRDPINGSSSSSAASAMLVLSTMVAVSGSYVFGTAIGYSSPTQSGIMDDLSLSVAEYSLFGSILTIGAMIGAVMSGRIADCIGRRGLMAFSEAFCIIGWLAIAFSQVPWCLDAGRLLVGYGMGLLSYVVPVFIAEITPKNLRGAFTTVHQLMICLGVSFTYLIGSFVSWRILALIGAVPCMIQLLGLFFIPESPRWLAKVGRGKECEAALQKLRGKNSDISDEAAEIRDYTETVERLSESTSVFELFQRKYAHSLLVRLTKLDLMKMNCWMPVTRVVFQVGVGLMVLQQFGGVNAIAFYASSIFVSAGFSGSIGTIAMVIVQIPMQVVGVVLMDISGRRPLLMARTSHSNPKLNLIHCLIKYQFFESIVRFFCFLSVLQSETLDSSHRLKILDNPSSGSSSMDRYLSVLCAFRCPGSFSLGMGGIPWVIMSEGSAGSLVTLVSWLGSWVVSYAFNFMMGWSSSGTFFMFSCIGGVTVVFVLKLVPETKGRTLEEIQASMNPFSRDR